MIAVSVTCFPLPGSDDQRGEALMGVCMGDGGRDLPRYPGYPDGLFSIVCGLLKVGFDGSVGIVKVHVVVFCVFCGHFLCTFDVCLMYVLCIVYVYFVSILCILYAYF